jgi:hypothetical protein
MANYSDIVDGMVAAQKRGLSVSKVVLSNESMDTFLTDEKFTEFEQQRQEETIGSEWELKVESGERDYLLTESGVEISL